MRDYSYNVEAWLLANSSIGRAFEPLARASCVAKLGLGCFGGTLLEAAAKDGDAWANAPAPGDPARLLF